MPVSTPTAIPNTAGVYIFRRGKIPIYIGKAANLKKRLSSYFRTKISDKTRRMREEATRLDWIETASDIEALLKESELIKKYHPKYNVLMRDDKNYFYVGLTREEFPKIFLTHQPRAPRAAKYGKKKRNRNSQSIIHFIGPFTNGASIKETLRLLRRLFPYCTCRAPHNRPCLNAQIGRCPGFCCAKQDHESEMINYGEYKKNIQNIVAILTGQKKRLIPRLKKEMREASRRQNFEHAAAVRNQILGLENIFRHRIDRPLLKLPKFHFGAWKKIERALQLLLQTKRTIRRVEGYDISNISGASAAGSMVVFIDGKPNTDEYRKFKIRTVRGSNDCAMLREVIHRRLTHAEWTYPDIMVIDGGAPQLRAIHLETRAMNHISRTWIIGLAKKRVRSGKEERLVIPDCAAPIPLKRFPIETAHFLMRVRDESHRFAKKYHHALRKKIFSKKNNPGATERDYRC